MIRPATVDDIPRLLELANQSPTAAHWNEQQYRTALDQSHPRRLVLVGDEGKIVGFAVAAEIAREWELENIVVDAARRRSGLASSLLGELLREIWSDRGERIFLEVRASNLGARALYEKWGFRMAGSRPGYYQNPPEDAILYKKNLSIAAPEMG